MSEGRKINLKVPFITRVEGEGALALSAKGDRIDTLHLKIFEPPRLFERFLQGKSYVEVPDLSARICGICPMAYQLTSILAFERLFEVELPAHLVRLRKLMNLGEWLQSHSLHIHFLAMPDVFGVDSALQLADSHGDLLKRGMQIQEAGNTLMRLLGGRSVHPVGLQVGGFSRLPTQNAWDNACVQVDAAIIAADQLLQWCAEQSVPDFSHDFVAVSLQGLEDYPINGGDIITSSGLSMPVDEYPQRFKEHQVSHSTAFYSLLDGKDYLVGPLARINLNYHRLPASVRQRAEQLGLHFPSQNMFDSLRARALECVWALNAARDILKEGCPEGPANVDYQVRAGTCCFATEAPRGLIYHHYTLEDDGTVANCTIIPPTSQNQARIEQDLKQAVMAFGLDKSDLELKHFCEQVIRNYDPCISCSTHFLDFRIKRDN
ncbi:nickel-dependent hydrogenase large subunit [Aestuariibacter halophilus]|uniref:Nickel-dependent hydrogenase large subunit n=1 Tax=Fluctibacter halophilus TaxID=226011 RepID=A0ABS8G4X3_9ALTE|nr:nickel-dependent hydrogenase large subunit [Aestuariibacter halophilus]MCC2615590.1 nickel-dependent hydrogenase large subunit [Aestuariibacter halophilus]